MKTVYNRGWQPVCKGAWTHYKMKLELGLELKLG